MSNVNPSSWPRRHTAGMSGSASGARLELAMARALLRRLGDPPVELVLWGHPVRGLEGEVIARVSVDRRSTFWRLALHPTLEFGKAFSAGRIQVEGDLIAALRGVMAAPRPGPLGRALGGLVQFFRSRNTVRRARLNVHHHYDLGNDFYRLWLDREMLYTCAYFASPDMTLEQAQLAKMELVCRKLRLEPGQRVVEAGGGWGSLALHMARHYGVRVKSYNVSQEQVAYARERARSEGFTADQVEFVLDDYRNIEGRYDAFVSVGMLEHVGTRFYRGLGRLIQSRLEPDGIGLIHTIGRNDARAMNAWIEARIFPGAQPPTLREMTDIFEPNGLSILDVENLRLHYALTLRHWLERYEQQVDEVRRRFDEEFERTWRLYLSGSVAAFEAGSLQLFQVVFNRAESNQLAMTRSRLYQGSALPPAQEEDTASRFGSGR